MGTEQAGRVAKAAPTEEQVESVIATLLSTHRYTPEEIVHLHPGLPPPIRARVHSAFRQAVTQAVSDPTPYNFEMLGRITKECAIEAMRHLAVERLS